MEEQVESKTPLIFQERQQPCFLQDKRIAKTKMVYTWTETQAALCGSRRALPEATDSLLDDCFL